MKRKWLSLILVAVMLFSLASPAGAAEVGASPEDIVPSGIDSPPVAEDGTPTEGGAPPETEDETLPEEDSPPETADGLPSEGDASPGSGADLLPGAEAANEIAPQGMQLFSSASDFNIQGNKLVGYTGAGGAVDIPEGVEIIGEGAFKNKTAVTSITIPASVQTIENAAFMGSGLTNVTIPDNVVTLGYSVYKNGDTENATFAGGTSYTGVFTNCVNLTSVHIGAGLSQIPPNTFNGCTKLTGVTIPNNITVVGTGAFLGCTSLASLSLPETLLTLGSGAFSKTELISVTIPGSVVSIKGCWYASSIGSKDNGVNAYNNRGVFM
ncbi:MAG: leucine-rich repeat protein, partial [Peptococcaceae bacterium]|nr:leucine-rich repeat protein [Peptococcaceae bacterium]